MINSFNNTIFTYGLVRYLPFSVLMLAAFLTRFALQLLDVITSELK